MISRYDGILTSFVRSHRAYGCLKEDEPLISKIC